MLVAMADLEGPMRVLEFYSGIGGLRYSLQEAGVEAVVVEAFDINEVANDVYEHNFGHRPSQRNIQRLTVSQLDAYKADTWIMSPPCQPYTRQGLRKDAGDARAFSFLQMLEMLPQMKFPPNYILVENVVGFEDSITHGHLIDMFEDLGFMTQEFILSPLQLGIPYSRPRYFCLAKKKPKSFVQPAYNNSLLCELGPLVEFVKLQLEDKSSILEEQSSKILPTVLSTAVETSEGSQHSFRRQPLLKMNEPIIDPGVYCRPVSDFMEEEPCTSDNLGAPPLLRKLIGDHYESLESEAVITRSEDEGKCFDMNMCADKWELYKLPSSVLERWGDCFDMVTKDSKRCCCFTKSYGSYAKGTGSVLSTKNVWNDGIKFQKALMTQDLPEGVSLNSLGLRYFTPREVANLHSFPPEFSFPSQVSLKQRYALLGNSLSVAVVGVLLRYLFSEPNQLVT
ncbi:tRNA (cytosine(38)-C(5))-methyltransferase 2 isoform X3 [Physcomitrium patens]|uniref:Uncharacterized protein n=1 Tax=Physcomitrium patens TaxID=3218 RepID=A0A2K1JPJ7_PHYPA|nr:tRNA (cytosine(38)-C(5))-methyltransferase-like isoform X3 [Physcomitrium patens]PNR43336.1 hypothetical protein PHYPA_015716 [Physcomitrium patens]|eukprot:XP_024390498.1 tRNA (cytosine(38)-C(5))-methyltransferase-like isoform X3 [Physcomitrella patens]